MRLLTNGIKELRILKAVALKSLARSRVLLVCTFPLWLILPTVKFQFSVLAHEWQRSFQSVHRRNVEIITEAP